MNWTETAKKTNSARKISRARLRARMRSSQEPISRSSVMFISRNKTQVLSMAGRRDGFAMVAPMVMAMSQHTEARAAKSARP